MDGRAVITATGRGTGAGGGLSDRAVLAEKLATAIMLGAANTRVRDYADIYTLTGRHDLTHGTVRAALDATARFRGVEVVPLSSLVDDLAELRERTYRAYRTALGVDGAELPTEFGEVVDAVMTFADPLARPTVEPRWRAAGRRWTVDVASNVAIGDRRDAAGQRATAPDASVRIGRMTCYLRCFRLAQRSD